MHLWDIVSLGDFRNLTKSFKNGYSKNSVPYCVCGWVSGLSGDGICKIDNEDLLQKYICLVDCVLFAFFGF